MANQLLPIDYYIKDKEMRDVVHNLHKKLDKRYKQASSGLESLYHATIGLTSAAQDHTRNSDEKRAENHDSTEMLHVAEVHQDTPPFVDNPGFSITLEDLSFGSDHDMAVDQIELSIDQLFGPSFSESDPEKEKPLSLSRLSRELANRKSPVSTKKKVIAPHLCTVAWNKAPKRYQECIAIVRTVDQNNQPLRTGGADIKSTFSWSRYDKMFCKVVDNEDGSYHIFYSASSVRFHLLFVSVNGCDVAGSPFICDIEDDVSWD